MREVIQERRRQNKQAQRREGEIGQLTHKEDKKD